MPVLANLQWMWHEKPDSCIYRLGTRTFEIKLNIHITDKQQIQLASRKASLPFPALNILHKRWVFAVWKSWHWTRSEILQKYFIKLLRGKKYIEILKTVRRDHLFPTYKNIHWRVPRHKPLPSFAEGWSQVACVFCFIQFPRSRVSVIYFGSVANKAHHASAVYLSLVLNM